MEKNYRLDIIETFYQDNYEEGEVEGTFQMNDITDHSRYYGSPEEALQDFAENYGAGMKMYKIDSGDGRAAFAFNAQMKDRYGSWADLSEADMQSWKEGKLKVYIVEWQARIVREEYVDTVNENALPFSIEEA